MLGEARDQLEDGIQLQQGDGTENGHEVHANWAADRLADRSRSGPLARVFFLPFSEERS